MIQLPYFLLPVAGDTPLNSVIFQLIVRGIYTYLTQLYAAMPSGGLVGQVLCKSGDTLTWGTYNFTDEKVKVTSSSVAGYFAEVIDTTTLEVYNNKVRLYGGVPNFLGLTDTPSTYTGNANKLISVATSQDKLEFVSTGSIPTGAIAMWSGSAESVPSGWVICNGTTKYDGINYTPNLTDYFVIGAGSSYSAPTLNTTSHTWVPGSSTTGGASTITLSSEQIPYHRHKASNFVSGLSESGAYAAGSSSNNSYIGGSTTFTWDGVGSGGSFSIMPPHYTLIFIMKTSS